MILFRNKRGARLATNLSMAELRVQKDIAELVEQRTASLFCRLFISPLLRDRPGPRVSVSISVKEDLDHLYSGALFECVIVFGEKYPFIPPTIIVLNRVYHPNVDIDTGELFLDLLSPDNWKPVITLSSVIFALQLTLLQPNFDLLPCNPVNLEMAAVHQTCQQQFGRLVRMSLLGGRIGAYQFAPYYGQLATLKRKREEQGCERRTTRKLEAEPMRLDLAYCA